MKYVNFCWKFCVIRQNRTHEALTGPRENLWFEGRVDDGQVPLTLLKWLLKFLECIMQFLVMAKI